MSTNAQSLDGTPLLLGDAHAMAYAPAGGAGARVLLVGPLLEEGRCAHRALHRAAVAMAAARALVLRVEPRGTGNSGGEASLEGWLDDLRAGLGWLDAQGDGPRVVIGCRAGALLAARVATGDDRLVLWQPVLSGKSYLRELQVRRMAQDSITGDKPPVEPFEVEGHLLGQSLHEALTALKLPDAKPVEDVRLVQVSFNEKLLAEYERLSAAWGIPEPACVVAEKFWLPHTPTAYAEVVADVVQAAGARASSRAQEPNPGARASSRAHEPGARAPEVPVTIPVSGGHLLGDLRPGGPEAVLILPGWGGTRYGPQRILWRTAEDLAARGYTTLRIDLRGRGDSTGDEAATLDAMIEDAVAAVRWLRETQGVTRVHLVGICSGGNVALGAAGLLDDIGTVICWSLLPFMEHKAKAAKQGTPRTGLLMAMLRKALRPETWRKLLRGEVNVKGAAQVLAKDKEGDDAEKARKTSARDILADLAARFTGDLCLLYGEKDPEAAGSRAFYEDWCRRHKVRVEVATIPGAPHTYYTATWTRAVVEQTGAWLGAYTAPRSTPAE